MRSGNDTAEFRRNYGANEFVNALYALDNGWTGKGVLVGVIDSGANAIGELAGQIDPTNSRDFGYVTAGGVQTKRDSLGDADSTHGTPVTAIIAGRKDGNGAMGYAPDVKIAVLRIDDVDRDAKKQSDVHILEALEYAGDHGIKVLNASLSGDGSADANAIYGAALTSFGAKAKGLVVEAAGNDGGSSPDDAGAMTTSNKNAILFVVATNGALQTAQFGLASYSNKAGTAMDRTVAAPGTNVTTMVDGTTVASFSGTSSATPVVTALAADILSKWPQLTGQDAGNVILNTAKDLGAPGVDPIYGHGLVDFQAALSPVNPTLSNSVATPKSVEASVMVVPATMSIISIKQALGSVTVLDAYGRDFTGSIAGMVLQPEATSGHWLRRRIAAMGGGSEIQAGPVSGSFAFAQQEVGPGIVKASVTSGQMAFVSGQYGFHAAWNAADSLQSDVMGLAPFADGILAYVPQMGSSFGVDRYAGGGRLGLTVAVNRGHGSATDIASSASAVTLGWSKDQSDVRFSVIDETGTIMGTPTGAGALNLGRGASTAMVEAHQRFGSALGWSIEGYGSVGYTRLKIDATSLVTGSTPLIGSRLGVQAAGPLLGGMLSLGVAQPLMIEAGSARLTFGTGYDLASQSLVYSTTQASLSGRRQVQLTAGFVKGGPRGSVRIGASQNVQDGSVRALAGYGFRF